MQPPVSNEPKLAYPTNFAPDETDPSALLGIVEASLDLLIASKAEVAPASPIIYKFALDGLVTYFRQQEMLVAPLGDGTSRRGWAIPKRFLVDAEIGRAQYVEFPRCLVTASASSARCYLLDLYAAGTTAIVGARTEVQATIACLCDEISSQRWRGQSDIVQVGAAAGMAPSGARTIAQSLASFDPEALLRGQDEDDPRGLIVVVTEDAAWDEQGLNQLISDSERITELGVIVAAPVRQAAVVIFTGPDLERHSLFVPLGTSRSTRAPRPDIDLALSTLLPRRLPGDPPEVEVSILGNVEIRNSAGSLVHRPKLTELVVYLAMHPEGATTPTWSTALWPDRQAPAQTVANRLSEARQALGFASDDKPRLRRNGERYVMAEVSTDWDTFRVLAARDQPPESWRQALELVRGRPFMGLHQDQWTVVEGFVASIEDGIAECALRCGEHELTGADPDAAAWAAQAGLRANPFDERLHRLLMRAADAAGNRAGIEHVLRHLALVMEIEGDPLRGVHPETAALYARLTRS